LQSQSPAVKAKPAEPNTDKLAARAPIHPVCTPD
jgi:hypothetical protein